MSAVVAECALDLAPDPQSASAAHAAIRTLILQCGQEQWLHAALLAVSELVTNAVLHADTSIKLVASCGEVLRVDIVDTNLPVLRADATEVLCSFFIEAHRTPSGRAVYVSWMTPKATTP